MGHVRLGTLPATRNWRQVVALIQCGAGVEQVANAAIRAAESGFRHAAKDPGVVDTVWLLARLPLAARAESFHAALYDLGVTATSDLTLMNLVAACTAALDARLPNNRGRTDLGEMAQMACAETLVAVLSERTASFFDATADDVRRELARLATVKHFGALGRAYFGRLTFKALDYFLSRALYREVGEGRRFLTLARVTDFTSALETHCHEAAGYVERFCGEWASRARWRHGGIRREDARDLAHGALAKMVEGLTVIEGLAGGAADGR